MKQKLIYLHKIFQGHPNLWLGLIIASGITSLDGIVSPYFIGRLTIILTKKQFNLLPMTVFYYFALMMLTVVSFWVWQYFNNKIIQVANLKLRGDAYHDFINNAREEDKNRTIAFINTDVKQIENQFINSIVMLVYCFEQALITLIYILCVNSWVALAYLVCGLLPSIVPHLTKKWIQKGTSDWSQKYKKYNLDVSEGINGFHLIKNYGVITHLQRLINKSLQTEEQSYFTMNMRQNTSRFLSQGTYVISMILALIVGIIFIVNGQITVGAFISLYMAADTVTSPIISMVQFVTQINAASPLLEEQLSRKSHIQKINNLSYEKMPDEELLNIKDASFGYQDKALLSKINLLVKNKDHVLIKGPSGVGKSTIFKTLLNEIPLIEGQILVNDKLENNFMAQVGVISQDTFIFSKSLRFNITLGDDFTDEQIITFLKEVDLDKFANEKGLNAQLGEIGSELSGGEKRKIELARALIRKKKILMLDESLSGLDNQSIESVYSLIKNFDGTIIDIEHNLNEERKKDYDQILELK